METGEESCLNHEKVKAGGVAVFGALKCSLALETPRV